MGRRSSFERRANDAYDTPAEAVVPLLPFLEGSSCGYFVEPCTGSGCLVRHLEAHGFKCVHQDDVFTGRNALDWTEADLNGARVIITNPPWRRPLLHRLIRHLSTLAPTWLLFDANWVWSQRAAPLLDQCEAIVAVGRVKWIPGSAFVGKEDAAWFLFDAYHSGGPRLYGRQGGLSHG